jgi:predicted GIY-YIG superfamily endonuclease
LASHAKLSRSEASEGCHAVARLVRQSSQSEGGRAEAGAGKQGPIGMKYVYILESLDAEHFYVGIADDVAARLAKHNAGEVPHTSKYRPWRINTYIAFSDEKRAIAFERISKIGLRSRLCQKAPMTCKGRPRLPSISP